MKTFLNIFFLTAYCVNCFAQPFINPPENLVTEGVPDLPAGIVHEVKNYTEARSASFLSWHPQNSDMLIATRFANSSQVHRVKFPGADRTQITFFDEPVSAASYDPIEGRYFIYQKDMGGNEFYQLFRYDIQNGQHTLLTDGKRSQNGDLRWNSAGDRIAYSSTKRNGQDRDIYMMDPLNPGTERLIAENKGGSWRVKDWSPDDKRLLLEEGISVSESRLYMLDLSSGIKTRIIPDTDERTTFYGIAFNKTGEGIYLITNRDNEYNRLAYFNLLSKELSCISSDIAWEIEDAALSDDGKKIAFLSNENGVSNLYLMSTTNNEYEKIEGLPLAVIRGLHWKPDSRSVAMTVSVYNASSDVFEYNIRSHDWIRWTESELGGMNAADLSRPELITWKSFDEKLISGYLYRAKPQSGNKTPVIINIHGGPEGQSRPGFIGSTNYYLNELGVSVIYPNVRGSTGYGKTFVDADNGFKREESVKDIGALLEWIGEQEGLDKDRIMVMGGSYGGICRWQLPITTAIRYAAR